MTDEGRRGPLDRLVGAVPVDALIRQVDVQALLERVDVNVLLDKVDVERLLSRIDLNEVLARVDLGEAIADASRGVAARTLDAIRVSAGHLDLALEQLTDRVLRRRREDTGPSGDSGSS